eukprot:s2309_g8.t4
MHACTCVGVAISFVSTVLQPGVRRIPVNRARAHCAAEPVSPALQVVRAARPVLRGVQWLANRVLGERPANLGCSHWRGNGDDDEASASETESEEELTTWQLPEERMWRVQALNLSQRDSREDGLAV